MRRDAWGDTLGFSYLDTNLANNTCCKQVVVMPIPSTTALADLDNAPGSFTVYPNPATNILYLRAAPGWESDNVQLSILDVMGRTLLVKSVSELDGNRGVTAVDVSPFPQGLYQVHLSTPRGISTKRFMIYK